MTAWRWAAIRIAILVAVSLLAPLSSQPRARASGSGFTPSLLRQLKFSDGTELITHQKVDHANVDTIPHWDGSYTYFKSTFGFSMVGSKPGTGQATTVVPTEIIPLRLVFSDGTVLDASSDLSAGITPVQGIINSPIYTPTSFTAGSTDLGTTQFGDAYQRANFWNIVSTKAQDYHVLLGSPTVLPAQTITVPPNLGRAVVDRATQTTVGLVNLQFLDRQEQALFAPLDIDPGTLPIFVFHNTMAPSYFGCCALGWHNAVPLSSDVNGHRATQTYVSSAYFDPAGRSIAGTTDVDVLNHEVAEWMDDPFVDNSTPSCSSLLEVGDPAEQFIFPVTLSGVTYHLQDIVFLAWFSGASPSTAVNGWYSFRNNFPTAQPTCPDAVELTGAAKVDVPGADGTVPYGINNNGDITGNYYSQDGSFFGDGFLLHNGTYTTIDVPGSPGTFPSKINDTGLIVGTYVDPDFSGIHGFSYLNGTFTTIDAPGVAEATEVNGVNIFGDIVGDYVGTDQLWHGYLLHNGQFTPLDVPCGANADTFVEGIDDGGEIVGTCHQGRAFVAFMLTSTGQYSTVATPAPTLSFPYSINNHGQIVGWDGFASFAVTKKATFLFTTNLGPGFALGNNDSGQVVGPAGNDGFILQIPKDA